MNTMNSMRPNADPARIPLSGTNPVLSGSGGYTYANGRVEHMAVPQMDDVEQDNMPTKMLGSHLASEVFGVLFGVPPGLLSAGAEMADVKEELNQGTQKIAGFEISNTVAALAGAVLKPEDALKADGGKAGKIIDRNADRKAAEAKNVKRDKPTK